MENRAIVYSNNTVAGILSREGKDFVFRYDENYFIQPHTKAISINFPKTQREYHSKKFFPFFYNLLSEGVNQKLQCRQFKIDEDDFFGLLLATGGNDTIGAITVKAENAE